MRLSLLTARQWSNRGFRVRMYERSRYQNVYGEPLFLRSQVRRVYY